MSAVNTVSSTATSSSVMETSGPARSALVIDGSYAMIGARDLGGKIDYIKLRAALEEQASTQFGGRHVKSRKHHWSAPLNEQNTTWGGAGAEMYLIADCCRVLTDCWFFDQNPSAQRINPALTAEYHMLKFAPPDGPQFQVSLFPMKKYSCHCKRCGYRFTQNVQKGVDNGIATKILSLAYENICDRFILFAGVLFYSLAIFSYTHFYLFEFGVGDGDFYSSLSLVRNVLRKDIWVIGYRGTVSGDLQQLASRVLWINDLWSQVKGIGLDKLYERGRREEDISDKRRKLEQRTDGARWFEDHDGEDFRASPRSCSLPDDAQEFGNRRQVVITPFEEDAASHRTRTRSRGHEVRLNGRGRGRHGRGRSLSRSNDRQRAKLSSSEVTIAKHPRSDVKISQHQDLAGVAQTKSDSAAEKKLVVGVNDDKKRKKIGTYHDSFLLLKPEGEEKSKRDQKAHPDWRKEKQANGVPIFTLSDVSSEEDAAKHQLPQLVPLKSAEPIENTMRYHKFRMDEVGPWSAIINLASDTESE
ncbi:uncharacterized protein CCR75_007338 [Bremia lactucae]|uniref:Uncharacterized protein n=1 Tax=Bremia lactucae TaxID=4779 RepID=A0A976IAN1_BRELC|nr:hypothetical protein CCR75_007338 [Bremia lactucae]